MTNPHTTSVRRRVPLAVLIAAALSATAVIAGCGGSAPPHAGGSGSPHPVAGGSQVPTGPAPPPFKANGPDEFRLAASHTPGIPFNVQRLRLSDGSVVMAGLGSGPMARSGGVLTDGFRFGYPSGAGMHDQSFRLAQGQSRVIGGKYRFEVLRLWSMPDPLNDAADVRITPLG